MRPLCGFRDRGGKRGIRGFFIYIISLAYSPLLSFSLLVTVRLFLGPDYCNNAIY